MLRVFAMRLRHLTMLVEDLSFHHVRSRLARALLQTAGSGSVSRVTQRQLADMVGTAREVAGREFRQMEAEGLIRIGRGWTEILNASGLQRLATGR
ncbi:MAG: winged helix-turn-helix domain-containing protein, partial [Chloroflexota bacterium]|nr:winged helix-turn-helix domain-containing protein [Chloroflexota bacterium]